MEKDLSPGVWQTPLGGGDSESRGERVKRTYGHPQGLGTPSPDLRVLPCGSPVPRGEDLGSRTMESKSLLLFSEFSSAGSPTSPPVG